MEKLEWQFHRAFDGEAVQDVCGLSRKIFIADRRAYSLNSLNP